MDALIQDIRYGVRQLFRPAVSLPSNIIGHFRYWLEAIGPELRQYIVTDNDEERPFSRDQRRWTAVKAAPVPGRSSSPIMSRFALGADLINVGREAMMAIGCIQAQRCHTGHCPTGVTTQDPQRQRALVVPTKSERVYHFHSNTLMALKELVQAAGLMQGDAQLARLFTFGVLNWTARWYHAGGRKSLDEIAEEAARFLLRG